MREWLKDFITNVEDFARPLPPELFERELILLACEAARRDLHEEEVAAETVTIRFLDKPASPAVEP